MTESEIDQLDVAMSSVKTTVRGLAEDNVDIPMILTALIHEANNVLACIPDKERRQAIRDLFVQGLASGKC